MHVLNFDESSITIYIPEPETEEIVLYLKSYCLTALLGTYRAFLATDSLVFLEHLHLSAKTLHARGSLYLTLGHIATGYLSQDAEVGAILLAKLLDEDVLTLIHKETVTRRTHEANHLSYVRTAVIHQQFAVSGHSARDSP